MIALLLVLLIIAVLLPASPHVNAPDLARGLLIAAIVIIVLRLAGIL